MPDQHALLGASSAHRWLNCTPSARLTENMPATSHPAAEEGTIAHTWCEQELRSMLEGTPRPAPPEQADEQMREAVQTYLSFVKDRMSTLEVCEVLVEQCVDYSHIAPGGFGTADCLILAEDHLHVIDFKYGVGHKVEAADNPQLKLYALGAVHEFRLLYDFKFVEMSIVQPRLGNISTFTMGVEELEAWGAGDVAPVARQAYAGEGEYVAGDWCRWCKAKSRCRTRADANLALAKLDFAPSALLTDDELSYALRQGKELEKWVREIEAEALEQAVSTGKTLPGFKVVESRSTRQWSNTDDVLSAALNAEIDVHERKLLSVAQTQKKLGKKRFDEVFADLVTKTPGKPTLVPDSDPRPPMNFTSAAQDFTN